MTDPADRFLEEKLHALARGVSAPLVPTEDDVRRGRRRLFRMRVAMAGATTAALAIVLGVTGLTAGDPTATETPLVTEPPSTLPATPTSSPADDSSEDDEPRGGNGNPGHDPNGVDLAGDTNSQHTDDGEPAKPRTAPTGRPPTGPPRTTGPAPDPKTTPPAPTAPTRPRCPARPRPRLRPRRRPRRLPRRRPRRRPRRPPQPPRSRRPRRPRSGYTRCCATTTTCSPSTLDPLRLHLQPYDRNIDSKETTTLGGRLYALGSTYRWEDGRLGSGLQIRVASGWDQVDRPCGASYADWACHFATTKSQRRRPARRPRRRPPTTA